MGVCRKHDAAMTSAAPELSEQHDLRRYVQWFDGALEPEFCAGMIASFDRLAHFEMCSGRGVMPALQASAWTELNVSKTVDASFEAIFRAQTLRYLALYNERVHLALPIPERHRLENLRIKRYLVAEGDQFQPHFDALDYTCNRYMVFIWYLNDVAEGGEPEFCDLGLRVAARAGLC